ncbi:MAG TPA: cation transporter [Candidatus Saccharimonadales bacterium]|nr:cation transporter [Candidatus Saccharimonadales bacterium]
MSEIETIRFPVAGMTCGSCVNRITRTLRRIDGVSTVRVDLSTATVTVGRDPRRVAGVALAAAVASAGYQADIESATVIPTNMGRSVLDQLLRRSR